MSEIFLDSNVCVYAFDKTEPAKQEKRYKFSFLDSVIVATALRVLCHTLYSEDLQHGQKIEGKLHIVNPFR